MDRVVVDAAGGVSGQGADDEDRRVDLRSERVEPGPDFAGRSADLEDGAALARDVHRSSDQSRVEQGLEGREDRYRAPVADERPLLDQGTVLQA
jgi:hypothetical protein